MNRITKIFLSIEEKGNPPIRQTFIGFNAVELTLIKISEKFLSPRISKKIEDILKYRNGEE